MTLDFATQGALLCGVARELTSTPDLEDVLSRVLQMTVETLGAEYGSILLLDPVGCIARRIPTCPDNGLEASDQAAARVMEEDLIAWALEHRKPALIPDVHTHDHWRRLPDVFEGIGSTLAVPLIHQERVNGLIVFIHGQQEFFTHSYVALAEAVARQAAVAVENARLRDEVERERSALHSFISSGLTEPTLLTDEAGRVTFANQAAVEALGIQDLGQSLTDLMPHEVVGRRIAQATATGRPQRMEILWRDGRFFDAKFAPVPRLGLAICLHDITHLKHLDEVQSHLLTIASHDLKSPLALIHGFAQLLLGEEDLSPKGRRCVQGILSGANKMQTLVHSLLDLEQIDAGICRGNERSEIRPVITGVIQDMQPRAAERGQRLTVSFPVGLPGVQIDPLRLEQVVKNLVDNAVKYTQEGGHIHVDAQVDNGGVVVRVQDDGPGIPTPAQPRLFERFFRVGTQATLGNEGTGLGLSIVRAIVEDCGGKVGVESEEGRGSTFWFWLPEAPLISEPFAVSYAGVTER